MVEKNLLSPVSNLSFLAARGISTENLIAEEPDANDVWLSMKLHQAKSKHRIKDGFFRVEICPAKEECQGLESGQTGKKMLDDAIPGSGLNELQIQKREGRR